MTGERIRPAKEPGGGKLRPVERVRTGVVMDASEWRSYVAHMDHAGDFITRIDNKALEGLTKRKG